MKILYEDRDLIVIEKPPLVPSQPDPSAPVIDPNFGHPAYADDGDLMVQMGFHDNEDDKRILLSVMCGREWIDKKHTDDGTHVVEDAPLDF